MWEAGGRSRGGDQRSVAPQLAAARKLIDHPQGTARVARQWAGIGKELFTTADTYVLQISSEVPPYNPLRQLIMASVMCIDMVLKE